MRAYPQQMTPRQLSIDGFAVHNEIISMQKSITKIKDDIAEIKESIANLPLVVEEMVEQLNDILKGMEERGL